MSVNWLLGVRQIARWCHSTVKEKGLHQPKAQGQKEARNEKAAYNKAHRDGKKEGTSRYVNEKLWLVRMDSES